MDLPPVGAQRQRQRRVAERERKRAVRACDDCRRQKEKCDGGVPCRRCVRLRKQCEFMGPPVGHGNPAPGRTARLQVPNQGNDDLAQRVKHMERLLQHYAGDISLDSENLRDLAEAVDRDHPLPRREQSVSQGSDYLGAENGNFTVQPLGNNMTHYSGEFSHWNFSMRIKQWIEQCVPDQARSDNPDAPNFKEYYRAEELQSPSEAFASLASLPPRYVADFLVQAFFKHAETNYFYVEEGWLLEKLDMAYGNAASMTRRDVGTVCIIFIVLAIGTQFAYLDSAAPGQGGPGQLESTGPFSEDAIGVMFYQQACKLVPDVITISSLESVQACLLIGIYALPLDASGLSYIYLNLAVKLAIQNGLHRNYPAGGLDPVIRETRNRVWWTAYTTERRVGIFHGRPISIASADIDAEMPTSRTDLWPSSSPKHMASMLATLRLHQILGKISHEISRLKLPAKNSTVEVLGRLVELKNDLQRWWDSLPGTICCKEPAPSSISRPDMHLKLEFCLVRMFAGRPFIFLRLHGRSNSSSSSSPADQPRKEQQQQQKCVNSPRKNDSRSTLVNDCVEAALTIIDTCKLLRSSIGLARASYTEFSACRAALLVIITQCLQGKTDRLRQCLRDGVAMIKVMSAGGESARSEASLIEVFERAIARLDATEDATGATAESDYTRFKKWEMLWKNDSPSQDTGSDRPPGGPMPPPSAGLWSGPGGIGRSGTTPVQGMTPSAAMDWNFSFPQTMDEFTSILGHGFGPGPDSLAGAGPRSENMWMGP